MTATLFAPLGSRPSLRQQATGPIAAFAQSRRKSVSTSLVCSARKEEKSGLEVASPVVAIPLATALAACLALGSATFPEDALAARSGGRVGGSAFRSSAPRSAPAPRAAPSPGPSSSRSYNYYNYSAPPLVGGYGYGGFGGGGINVFPSFGVPILGLGGGFFNIIIIGFVFSAVAGVVRSLLGGRRRDDLDDLD